MALTYRDRRRLVLATLVTIVALPALWWTSRAEESAAPNVAVAGAGAGVDVGADRSGDDAAEGDATAAAGAATLTATDASVDASAAAAQAGTVEVPPPTTAVTAGTPGAATTHDDAPGAQAPVYLGGPSSNIGAGLSQIAVPAAPSVERINTTATFRSNLSGASCGIPGLINARTVTIVNLDNGRSVTCKTVLRRGELGDEIHLATELFSQLADITDAPIPVEIRR